MHATRELILEDGDWKSVLVVTTDLQINPNGRDYDASAEADLQVAIVDFMKAQTAVIDTVYVRSARADA